MELLEYFKERPIFAIFIVSLLVMAINAVMTKIAKNKAKVGILTEKDTVEVNQQIMGSVTIEVLKTIAIEKIKTELKIYAEIMDSSGKRQRSRLYKEKHQFTNSQTLRQGQYQEFHFNLAMPDMNQHPMLVKKIQSYANRSYNLRCQLVTKVYCKGANIKAEKGLLYIHKEQNFAD